MFKLFQQGSIKNQIGQLRIFQNWRRHMTALVFYRLGKFSNRGKGLLWWLRCNSFRRWGEFHWDFDVKNSQYPHTTHWELVYKLLQFGLFAKRSMPTLKEPHPRLGVYSCIGQRGGGGWKGGGVLWEGRNNVPCTCNHASLRYEIFSCTCTHVSCYAMRSIALAPTFHATLRDLLLHLPPTFHATLWDVSCYAMRSSLALALRTRDPKDRRMAKHLFDTVKSFMFRHNCGCQLWSQLGKLAKENSWNIFYRWPSKYMEKHCQILKKGLPSCACQANFK